MRTSIQKEETRSCVSLLFYVGKELGLPQSGAYMRYGGLCLSVGLCGQARAAVGIPITEGKKRPQ